MVSEISCFSMPQPVPHSVPLLLTVAQRDTVALPEKEADTVGLRLCDALPENEPVTVGDLDCEGLAEKVALRLGECVPLPVRVGLRLTDAQPEAVGQREGEAVEL